MAIAPKVPAACKQCGHGLAFFWGANDVSGSISHQLRCASPVSWKSLALSTKGLRALMVWTQHRFIIGEPIWLSRVRGCLSSRHMGVTKPKVEVPPALWCGHGGPRRLKRSMRGMCIEMRHRVAPPAPGNDKHNKVHHRRATKLCHRPQGQVPWRSRLQVSICRTRMP